ALTVTFRFQLPLRVGSSRWALTSPSLGDRISTLNHDLDHLIVHRHESHRLILIDARRKNEEGRSIRAEGSTLWFKPGGLSQAEGFGPQVGKPLDGEPAVSPMDDRLAGGVLFHEVDEAGRMDR